METSVECTLDRAEVILPTNESIQIENTVVVEANGSTTATGEEREAQEASVFANLFDIV